MENKLSRSIVLRAVSVFIATVTIIAAAMTASAQIAHTNKSKARKAVPTTNAQIETRSSGQPVSVDPQTGRLRGAFSG